MSKLELILLGRFECLLSSGTRISLPMRKAEVLLAFLALTPGLRHPRERLINLLWSDRGEEQARNSLRQCLSAIRKALGDVAGLALAIDRTTVCLNAGLIEVDAIEFERLALEGDYESLATAAELYQGEFLEGIAIRDPACQEWLESERARFRRQFIEILTNLAETQLVSHDFAHAIRSAERLVKQDPLGEAGWRLLIRAYADSGDRSHALQAFKRCQQVLRDELEVEPEPATIELRDRIAGGKIASPAAPASPAGKPPAKSARGASPASDHSIAVLPFDNLSGDPEQEYFSDGITDSIILHLSLFPGLNVKSRNSSFAFKAQIKSLGEISRELGVDYIVEGSIRRSADRIRITVQLIETDSGNQVWGNRYEAGIENLFDLEEELSRTIAATVTGQIESDLQRIALAKGAADQRAYDLLLAGIYHVSRFNRQDNLIAIEKLTQCLRRDPDNVRAHVMLYACHVMDYLGRWTEDYLASFELAEKCIRRALELDPDLPLVHVYSGEFLSLKGELEEALKHVSKALEINPNDSGALSVLAFIHELRNDGEAALEAAEQALALDPYHPWAEWEVAGGQYLCGCYADALETFANLRTSPGFVWIFVVAAHLRLGQVECARQALQDFLRDCRETMLSMPKTLDEWLQYLRESYPFEDPALNQGLLDYLVQAGLDDEVSPPHPGAISAGHSIAVLPFDNLSGDAAQEYFSDGITESIILNLSLFPQLVVKSRNSSFAFKQQLKSPGEISKELGVDYLVEGSIRKTDERVRVTVQLVEAGSGNQVWGKRYDAEIDDLFELEESLSRSIAATVTGQIESELQRIALAKGAVDQQAYDLLLRGNYHMNQASREGFRQAIEELGQCLAIDPGNARAHAVLYDCHLMTWMDRIVEDYEPSFDLAGYHARKALEFGPDYIHALRVNADFMFFNRNYKKANEYLDRALAINPNDPDALCVKVMNLSMQGKTEDALHLATSTKQLDPYNWWIDWNLAEAQYLCGHYEEALETIASSKNAPNFIRIYSTACHVKLGQMDAAQQSLQTYLQECRESMAAMPKTLQEWRRYTFDTAPFEDAAINEDILDCLVKAGLERELVPSMTGETSPDLPSVAVLPFENMSGDPEQEYFSDGITASIILSLGLYKGLAVKSQNSSFAYKNSSKSSEEIAEALHTDYLVEGSMRKSTDKVRISAQLIETESGNQIWGKQFDAELENILELEQDLSQTIAATISGRIGHTLQQSAVHKTAKNLQSYDFLLRGLYYFGKFTATDFTSAKREIGKCLEIDPENATAHTNLGMIHWVDVLEGWTDNQDASEKLTRHHLETAIQLEPDNSLAHAWYGEYLNFKREYEKSEFHVDKAIELNPTAPEGYLVKADLLSMTRRNDEAIPYADKCLQLDPHSVGAGWTAGGVYQGAGKYEKAIKTYRSIPHPPTSIHALIAACFAGLGLKQEARREMKRYQELAKREMPGYPQNEDEWRRLWHISLAYRYDEDFEEVFQKLVQAGLLEDLAADTDETPSIAVLPFENMSGDPEQEHFSDGITADLIDTLSKFRHMRTVSRYSVQAYKTDKPPLGEIAAQQGVRYILEGSVRKSGERIRVNAELIDSADDRMLWSERYDRDLDDLFAVQDEITQQIALAMKIRFDDGDMALNRSGTVNTRAWELVLAAIDLQDTYIQKNIIEARQMARQAIELDPDYAYAWVCLAWTYWQEAYSGWSDSIEDSMAEATRANQRAQQLNPESSEVWSQAATIHLMNHEAEAGLEDVRRAIDLEPGNAETQALMAYVCNFIGEHELARHHIDQMKKLCPVLPNWYYMIAGNVERFSGNLDEAVRVLRRGIEVEPESPLCRFYLINVLMELGDEHGAAQLAAEIRALDKNVTGKGFVRSESQDGSIRDRFRANLEKFGLY